MPDFPPPHLAVWFKSEDLQVLETPLELRADPNCSTMNVAPPLGFCRTMGAVDLLVFHGVGQSPLHNVAFCGDYIDEKPRRFGEMQL